jgi:chemotaxis protein MotB
MLKSRRSRHSVDAWPGFVDALASVLLVFVFMLMIFVLGQYFLTDVLLGRDRALERLKAEVAQLADHLSMAEQEAADSKEALFSLQGRLDATLKANQQLVAELDETRVQLGDAQQQVSIGEKQLEIKLRELASLQQDIAALRELRKQMEGEIAGLGQELKGSQTALETANREIGNLRDRSKSLTAKLAAEEERTLLAQREVQKRDIRILELSTRIEETAHALREEQQLSQRKRDEVGELKRSIDALQAQLSALSETLELKQRETEIKQVEIDQLTKRLNLELARKVKELNRYRSEFFGKLREVLGDHPDIRIEGDRFTLQSELLFESGSEEIGEAGQQQLTKLADTLQELASRIPAEIDWVLRVDGHTDRRSISTERFPSNWELSTARAVSIVKFLIDHGIPAKRLAATGFAEFHPLDPRRTAEAYQKNRRIEIKLTGR